MVFVFYPYELAILWCSCFLRDRPYLCMRCFVLCMSYVLLIASVTRHVIVTRLSALSRDPNDDVECFRHCQSP